MSAGEQVRIDGLRIVLRDAVLDDLDMLAFWLQPDQRWHELNGPIFAGPTAQTTGGVWLQIIDGLFPGPC